MSASELAALRRSVVFNSLDEHSLRQAIASADMLSLHCTELLFTAGDRSDFMFVVLSGLVRTSMRRSGDREFSIRLVGVGELIGECSLCDEAPRTTSARAITQSRILAFPMAAMQDLLRSRPAALLQLLDLVARRLGEAEDLADDLQQLDAAGRLAKQLLHLAPSSSVLRVTPEITQAELSLLVGASRETTNRLLARFARRGWITLTNKTIIVQNPDALAFRAGLTTRFSA